jgi:hypothetical protein
MYPISVVLWNCTVVTRNTVAILGSIQADCSYNWKMLSLLAPQKHERINPMYVAKRLNCVLISSVSQDKIFLSAAFANSLSTFMMITLKLSLTLHYTVPTILLIYKMSPPRYMERIVTGSRVRTPVRKFHFNSVEFEGSLWCLKYHKPEKSTQLLHTLYL